MRESFIVLQFQTIWGTHICQLNLLLNLPYYSKFLNKVQTTLSLSIFHILFVSLQACSFYLFDPYCILNIEMDTFNVFHSRLMSKSLYFTFQHVVN